MKCKCKCGAEKVTETAEYRVWAFQSMTGSHTRISCQPGGGLIDGGHVIFRGTQAECEKYVDGLD